jgi:hypothetical protein
MEVEKVQTLFIRRYFIARVDYKPLVSLIKNKMTILTKGWIETIIEYNFSTKYLPGKENDLTDSLSRCYERTVKVVTVDEKRANLEWKAEKRGYKLLNRTVKDKLIEKQHALGYFGVKLMVEKIKEAGYWWPNMRKELKRMVRKC